MPKSLLVILCITLGIVVAAGARLTGARPSRPAIIASLATAPGVRTGASVTYRGVQVGAVEAISFGDSTVLLTLRLTRPDVPLRNTDRIGIHTLGLLGDKGIAVVPSSTGGRPWQPGDTLRGMPPDTLADARDAAVRAAIESAIGKLFHRDTFAGSAPAGSVSP